jgi:general secretion pathway protein G
MSSVHSSSRGFTLIELLAVIAIVALLAALILGLAGNAQRSSARKRAEAEINQLQSFVDSYRTQYGKVPGKPGDDETALSKALGDAKHSLSNLLDPWDNSYHYYAASKQTCYIWSTAGDNNGTNRVAWIGNPRPEK